MFDDLLLQLDLKQDQLQEIRHHVSSTIRASLNGEKTCLACLNTFIYLPHSSTHFTFLAIDLGGTNLRVALCYKHTHHVDIIVLKKVKISEDLMSGDVHRLFDFTASVVKTCLAEHDTFSSLEVGFTFSFPVQQETLSSGIILDWSKQYNLALGFDPVQQLALSFKKYELSFLTIKSLLNDTSATLLANRFIHSNCYVGLILGTGTNMSLCVPLNRVQSSYRRYDKEQVVINCESGNFNVGLPRTTLDIMLDNTSSNPGRQFAEKMVSGLYLGRLVSLALQLYFSEESSHIHWQNDFHLDSVLVGRFQHCDTDVIDAYFKQTFKLQCSNHDLNIIQRLCQLITKRSAAIASALLVGAVDALDIKNEDHYVVGVDGSLFFIHPGYKDYLKTCVDQLTKMDKFTVSFSSVDQSSLIGVADTLN